MSTITIDDKNYKIDNLSDRQKGLAHHCIDLQRKIINTQKDLEQLITCKNAYSNDLVADIKKQEKPQAAE